MINDFKLLYVNVCFFSVKGEHNQMQKSLMQKYNYQNMISTILHQ